MIDGFSKMFRELQYRFDVPSGLGISAQLADMARAHQVWNQNFAGIGMLASAAKEASRQHKILTTGADLASSIKNSIRVPQTVFDAIQSINQQHSMLLGAWKNTSILLSAGNEINLWRKAIASLSSEVATLSTAEERWDFIDELKSVSENAVNLTEKIIEKQVVTPNDLAELKNIVQRVESKVDAHDKEFISIFY